MKTLIAALCLFSAYAIPALAEPGVGPNDPIKPVYTAKMGITNESGQTGVFDTSAVGTWEETIGEDGQLHYLYNFENKSGFNILSTDGTNTVLGTIYSLNYDGKSDPQVVVNFSVKAGSSDSTFSFYNSIDVIPPIENPIARASASITLTDNSIPSNGAYINGAFGGKTYQARYNNGTVFTNLVGGFSNQGGSTVSSLNDPADGITYRPVVGTITQMEAEYKFVLKRYDSASGTSNFVMLPTPEPSGMLAVASGIVGLLGFGLKKRR